MWKKEQNPPVFVSFFRKFSSSFIEEVICEMSMVCTILAMHLEPLSTKK
jgi:hypothetical protein